jgi:hypothetical protein
VKHGYILLEPRQQELFEAVQYRQAAARILELLILKMAETPMHCIGPFKPVVVELALLRAAYQTINGHTLWELLTVLDAKAMSTEY